MYNLVNTKGNITTKLDLTHVASHYMDAEEFLSSFFHVSLNYIRRSELPLSLAAIENDV